MGGIMSTSKKDLGTCQKFIALALLVAFAPAYADDTDDFAQLTKPESVVSAGASAASGDEQDRTLFGQYNGLRKHDFNLLLDFDYVKRDNGTGTWTTIRGRDLGLDTPELGIELNRQGDWKFSLNYEQIVKHDPRTINTGLLGAGTTTPAVSSLATPGTGQDLELELKRKRFGLDIDKWLTPSLQVQLSFKNEDKDGSRLWGKGFACSGTWQAAGVCSTTGQWGLLMLPEPVDSNTRQVEAKLNFSSGKLFLSGGYYGSFYTNHNGTLAPTINGTLYSQFGATTITDTLLPSTLALPMALWPDNQAHQFYLDGTYALTPRVRSTFKLAYTHATQNEDFGGMGLTGAPAGVNNLGGERNTTLAQLGLTARPIAKLSVIANVRYEDRKDKTPIEYYNIEGTNPNAAWTNDHFPHKKLNGKLEGIYQLTPKLRGTLGIDYESIDRGLPLNTVELAGLAELRQKTEEIGYRAQLRRAFSDTFSGSLSYVHSERTGSSQWYNLCVASAFGGCPTLTYGQMISDSEIAQTQPNGSAIPGYFLDRKRDKGRLTGEWTPSDGLSLQLVVEDGRDHFDPPGGVYTGSQGASAKLYSLDMSYSITYRWKLTAYASRSDQKMQVAQPNTNDYSMAFRDLNDAVGVGLAGNPTSRLDVGANLSFINDRNIYDQSMGPTASATNVAFLAASGGLPDVTFRQTRVNLYGKYALDKHSAVRVDVVHERNRLNEWTWGYAGVPFTYADNTTVTLNPNQNVTLVMGRYIYSFR